MRKVRENKHNRVYHLISRIARRAFFLDAYGAVRDGGGTGSNMIATVNYHSSGSARGTGTWTLVKAIR